MLPLCPLLVTSAAAVHQFQRIQRSLQARLNYKHWHPAHSGYQWAWTRQCPQKLLNCSTNTSFITAQPLTQDLLLEIPFQPSPQNWMLRTQSWQQISKEFLCPSFQAFRKMSPFFCFNWKTTPEVFKKTPILREVFPLTYFCKLTLLNLWSTLNKSFSLWGLCKSKKIWKRAQS